jgi:hypothetical protein
METIYIDVVIFICFVISLVLYIISGFLKKLKFKEMFETRIEKVFFTLMKIIFINVLFYIVLFGIQKGISQEEYKMFIWFMILICSLIWFHENSIKGFKESRNEIGYTKIDYVGSVFLVIPCFLFIIKFVLILPDIFY